MSRRKPYAIASDRFDTRSGQVMWRSLEEKEAAASGQTQALRKAAEAELPGGFAKGLPLVNAGGLLKKAKAEPADVSVDIIAKQPRVSRRGFLQASSAAGAALALQGCIRRPESNILPFSKGPEYTIPGIPQHFATVTARGNDALGLLVTSNEGRPTKIEGNPQHTSSMGRTDLRAQAQLWDLYDPDRSHGPAAFDGDDFVSKSWEDVDAALAALVEQHTADRGAGLVVLSAPTSSPSFIRIRDAFEARFPEASFHEWTSVPDGNFAAGAKIAFGEKLYPLFDLAPAEVVVALDSDFLGNEPGSVRNARSFAPRRALTSPDRQRMNRLYAVEATYSVTGAMADHRLRVKAARVGSYLRALAKTLADKGLSLGPVAGALSGADTAAFPTDWLGAVADDLLANRGKSVVIAGPRQPAAVHALAATINDALGNLGRTVAFFPPTDLARQEPLEGMRSFAERAESAKTVLVLGGNPVYDAPADVDVAALLGREGVTSIHLASHRNETSAAATLHVPESHELETWGDLRAADGIFSIQQPLIRPLWGSRSALEVLAHVAGERNWRGHAVVRKTFRASYPDRTLFETTWRRTLHAGLLAGTQRRPARVAVRGGAVAGALAEPEPSAEGIELQFLPSPGVWDGRHTNNLWALELPDPLTKIVWDNAAVISKATRNRLGLRNGQMVRISRGGSSVELPVWALPGHADDSVTLLLGWGRTRAGRYGNKQKWQGLGPEKDWYAGGFDVHPLRTSDAFYFAGGASLEVLDETYDVTQTQTHGNMEGRPIAIDATVEEYRENPEWASYETVEMTPGPLWDEVDYENPPVRPGYPEGGVTAGGRPRYKWGMVIDLSACTGCNACVIACQAENNIPAVGKQEVARGREMAWLRIDRYFVGETDDDPQISLQPVGCQHCEEAPCENVCPVNATVHTPDGMNAMAYNRCVGTRYCANNCPYKVRRFNYLDWHSHLDQPWTMHGNFPETRQMVFNPNVTVRMRGVMEKCSYCIQRVQEAKFAARREHRQLRDGDVVSACQQVCPSGAIVFGDLNLENSRVARAAAVNRGYKLLAEVGAQPRTTFLGKLRNPNPAFASAAPAPSADEESH